MKNMIQTRLNKIENLNDRKLLKSVLIDVYENMMDYNKDMYRQLEQRLYNETEIEPDKTAIYTAMDYLDNIDPISDFLHPMIQSDLENPIDLKEMTEKINVGDEVTVASIFMKCSNSIISKMLSEGSTYKCVVKTNANRYELNAKARRCTKYIDEIERLYRVFQQNKVAWNTVNCPYAYKFIDIVMVPETKFVENEVISEVSVDLGEYDAYKELNVIPLWNIRAVDCEDKSFPMPANDRINYDHFVSLEKHGEQNAYLIALGNLNFLYSKRLENGIVIVSDSENQEKWTLLKIEAPTNLKRQNISFEMLSNKKDLGFVGRYAAVKSLVIRTRGEIARLMNSYAMSKHVSFQSVEILENYDGTIETIDYNSFIDDNIRIDASKKIMLLKFVVNGGENYLNYDKISFLVSEIQLLFPEYKCVGALAD